jgi:hypothetical protein
MGKQPQAKQRKAKAKEAEKQVSNILENCRTEMCHSKEEYIWLCITLEYYTAQI